MYVEQIKAAKAYQLVILSPGPDVKKVKAEPIRNRNRGCIRTPRTPTPYPKLKLLSPYQINSPKFVIRIEEINADIFDLE